MLLKTLVIPIIEYGSILKNLSKQSLINEIENVQQRFTSKLNEMELLNYCIGRDYAP